MINNISANIIWNIKEQRFFLKKMKLGADNILVKYSSIIQIYNSLYELY